MTAREAIERVMMVNAFGAKNAKSREVILAKVNELTPDKPLTDREFRRIYAEIADELLFGSNPEIGYFIISSKEDLALAVSPLDKAAESIAVRKNTIFSAYEKRYGTVDRQRDLLI